MLWDLIIIGAGPIGNFTGYLSASLGLKVVILEEHNKIGEPLHCLGKLSVHAFKEFLLPQDSILFPLKGGYFYSPSGKEIKLKKEKEDSYILDRVKFDEKLGEISEKKGTKILLGSKAFGIEHFKGYSEVYYKEKERINKIKGKVIVDAEGAKRQFLRNLGISVNPFLIGFQYEVSGISLKDKECVELYFGEKYSKGFFSWISPFKDNLVKIGVAVYPKNNPQIFLDNLIFKIKERIKNLKIEKRYSGIIPLYGPYEMYIPPNIIVVGDAGGFNKSTTGGGIYFGLKGAKIAVNQIYRYLETGNLNFLKNYPRLIKKSFGKELFFTGFIRRFLNKLSDKDLEEIWDIILKNPDVIKKLEEKGDTAYQSSILSAIPSIISNPKNLKSIKFIPFLFRALLENI
ncbi:MAG: NAD(P)/FAD-dependent oxidoreductase [Dictyoglomus sp.]|nr:NAD(P)/FAD-dependent oxidoreductase [Dictyoglomus sp.]MDW8187721.1 NAD(P)/FAD-dependent oxidoreductase [Dictyoglomus sp.]